MAIVPKSQHKEFLKLVFLGFELSIQHSPSFDLEINLFVLF